jgi:hypothetical protein
MYQLAKTSLTQIHSIEPIVLRSLIGECGIDLAACIMGTRCNDMRPYLESELVYSASKSGSDVPDRRAAGSPYVRRVRALIRRWQRTHSC